MKATKPRYRQFVTCRGCGEEKRHEGHGLCRGCHIRWDRAGRPASGPPPAMSRQARGFLGALYRVEGKANRLEDYADLASWHVPEEEAAARLGVSVRTVYRYRAELRDGPLQLRLVDAYGEQRRAS